MWADYFPGGCSRLKIFLCHAHDDRAVAEEAAQALKNDGHIVFFDKDSLPAAADYNEQIRKAIHAADRFIFLISRRSLAEGKFTLSELQFAKERWPNAEGSVIPVLIDKGANIADVPAYLRSVHILQIEGNAPAEIVAAIAKSRRVSAKCVLGAGILMLGIVFGGLFAFDKASFLLPKAEFALMKPDQIDFRPMQRPAAGSAWLDSEVAVTVVPVQYNNTSGRPVRIHDESVDISMAGTSWKYRWFNEVDITPKSCETDWLCIKRGLGAETMDPGHTLRRETMFIRQSGSKLSWKTFLDKVYDPAVEEIEVRLTSRAESSLLSKAQSGTQATVCRIDVGKLRTMLTEGGFKAGAPPHPPRVSPFCL